MKPLRIVGIRQVVTTLPRKDWDWQKDKWTREEALDEHLGAVNRTIEEDRLIVAKLDGPHQSYDDSWKSYVVTTYLHIGAE